MDSFNFVRFVASEGFAIAFGTFVCIGLWRGSGFIGRRFFGKDGYMTQYVESVKETHKSLQEAHQQSALAVSAIQKVIEYESDRRAELDNKVQKVLDVIQDGSS